MKIKAKEKPAMKTNNVLKPLKSDSDIMKLIKDEKGATAVEYGLMLVAVLIAVSVGMKKLGTNVNTAAGNAASAVQ